MNWSEIKDPTRKMPNYHITCDTPLGELFIFWDKKKEWYYIEIHLLSNDNNVKYISAARSIEDAKYKAKKFLSGIKYKLNKYFKNYGGL